MKRKLIKKNITKVEVMRKHAIQYGIPFWLYYHDSYVGKEEMDHYRFLKWYSYTKQGRLDGAYEMWTGKEPTRLCVGSKGKL